MEKNKEAEKIRKKIEKLAKEDRLTEWPKFFQWDGFRDKFLNLTNKKERVDAKNEGIGGEWDSVSMEDEDEDENEGGMFSSDDDHEKYD